MTGQAQCAYLTGGNPAAAASAWAQQQNGSVSTAEKYLSGSNAMRPVLKRSSAATFIFR